jgi:hypothetical protein
VSRALVGVAAGAALCWACVAFDPNSPAVPHLAGRYATLITIRYQDQSPNQQHLETRFDSLAATVVLPDAEEHGFFEGSYRTDAGDVGTISGTLHPDGTMLIREFGQPPILTLQGATFLHRLYPWCDFLAVGTGTLLGQLSGDSLVIEGRASLLCRYQLWDQTIRVGADLDVRLAGAR